MGICNDDCDCYLDGADGVIVDGLGSAGSPYVISTDVGRHIPFAMTNAARLALSVGAADQGLIVFETDTGAAWIYDGATHGWRRLSVYAVETEGSETLNQANGVIQTILTLALEKGVWAVTAKGYIESSVSVSTGWNISLYSPGVVVIDAVAAGVSAAETAIVETYYRSFALQDLLAMPAAGDITMGVIRSTQDGTQICAAARIMATSVSALRP